MANSRVTKYFFGYALRNGKVFPLTWAEDDGICIGGKGGVVQEYEISFDDYITPNFSVLTDKYPEDKAKTQPSAKP